MTATRPVFLGRSDTFFGVCEALGQDFGFNANWLRAGLGVMLLFNPVAVAATYVALGVLVLGSRLIVPDAPRAAKAAPVTPVAVNDENAVVLAKAA